MENRKEGKNVPKTPRRGKYCVAFGCNSTNANGISLHDFPKENRPQIRRQWINFVRTKRKDFADATQYSVLCEKHFNSESYPLEYQLKKSMGIPVAKKFLLPNAVPTIHVLEQPGTPELKLSSCDCEGSTPAKRPRKAFRKRELARLMTENITDTTDEAIDQENIAGVGDIESSPTTRTIGMQFSGRKPPRRSIKTQARPKVDDKVTQCDLGITAPKTVSVGIQCNMHLDESLKGKSTFLTTTKINADTDIDHLDMDQPMDMDDNQHTDCEYYPDLDEHGSDDEDYERITKRNIPDETKYIVFEGELLELFKTCPKCASNTMAYVKQVVGSLCRIHQSCGACNFSRIWDSQPTVGAIPAGNLLMSAAILFSGSIPSKAIRLLDHMNVAAISTSTFHQHQKFYLQPAICDVWRFFQQHYVTDMLLKGKSLTLGGDGRSDTPGHSAKFGSYGMLDLDLMLVVDVQLVQSNEVKNSYHMEKEGFIRSMNYFKSKGLIIKEIVTDRHVQLVKYIREELPDVAHYFDVWHVAKGLKKKLTSLANEKECDVLHPWIKSICNHLYWVAASTPDGNGSMMVEKWQSLANHVQNIHRHDGDLFTECQHGELEGRERQKKWIKSGTKVCEKLDDLVFSRQMKKDVSKLSPGPQTAALEAFHSVINHFAPKMIGFSYHGMLSRIILAALHYNENGMRDQAVSRDGQKRYSILFPKFKKGGYTVKEIKVGHTYGYVHELMDKVVSMAESSRMKCEEVPVTSSPPPALCSLFERPDKEEAVKQFTSRYRSSSFSQSDKC